MNQQRRDDDEPRAREAAARAGGLRIGSVLGVEIRADWSLLIIFGLILLNLGLGLLPSWHPDWGPVLTWGTALAAATLFFASITAHELSHAVVARRNGIPVSRITLFLFGGMAHMESEPPSPRSEFLMAVVGPITSLAIGIVAGVAGAALAPADFATRLAEEPEAALASLSPLASLLLWLGPINVLLGLFNVVPGFPLDGGRVFRSLAWWATDDIRKATRWASNAGRVVAWTLMAWGVLSIVGGGLLQGFWLLLIGWFLNNAARASYQQLLIRETLRDVPVERVMRTRFETIAPDARVDVLVSEHILASDQRAFPVVGEDGRLAGLVCLDDVRRVPRERWAETPVSEAMTPVGELVTLPSDAPAERALKALAERGVDQVPVLDDGRAVGLVRRHDLMTWLSLHLERRELSAAFGAGQPA